MIKCYFARIDLMKKSVFEKFSKEEKYAGITNDNKRKEKITRDLLFNYVVEKENINPEILYNRYGKPDFKDKRYHFNISHSKDYAMMVVSSEEVGVDVQKISSYNEEKLDKLASRIYNDNDYNYFNTDDNTTFTQIWTINEAYLKYIGVGLVKNLHDIEIDYEQQLVSFERDREARYVTCYCGDYLACVISKRFRREDEKELFRKKVFYDDENIFDKE